MTPTARPFPWPRPWMAVAIASVSAGLMATACRAPEADAFESDPARETREAVPVTVATIGTTDRPAALQVAATLSAKEEIPLAFKIGGVVARIAVEPGERVREGQVLAALADDEIGAAVRKAREGREKAERDLARARALYADSAVTRAQFDDAATAVAVARADEQTAAFNQRYALITAPADGIVLRRQLEAGEQVPAGQPVLVLRTARRGMVVRVSLSDRERLSVAAGDAADVRFDAVAERTFTGVVRVVGAAPAPMTGAYEAEVEVLGADGLPSGLVGTATILPRVRGTRRPVPLVPVEALVEADGDSAAVFVVTNDIARRRAVRIGPLVDGAVTALAGLAAGDRVVVAGGAYLADGFRVRTTPQAGAERVP